MKTNETQELHTCKHCGAMTPNPKFCSGSCRTTYMNLHRSYGPNPKAIAAMRESHQLNPGRRSRIPAANKKFKELLNWPEQWSEYKVPLTSIKTDGGPRYKAFIDFVVPSLKLGIEIDGAKHRMQFVQSYDEARTESLNKLGWKIIRFPDTRLETDPQGLVADILAEIAQAPRDLNQRQPVILN